MNKSAKKFISLRAMHLPKTARTRSGVEYSPSTSKWAFRDGVWDVSISFLRLQNISDELVHGLKLTLIWMLENRSPCTSANYYSLMVRFFRSLSEGRKDLITEITPEDIIAYKLSSMEASYQLAGGIRSFIKRWVSLGAPGIGNGVAVLLSQLKLTQSPVGVAVATLDPKEGPFSDLEYEAIQIALNDAYAKNEIERDTFLLCYLLMAFGGRPVQYACMKCRDLISPQKGHGSDYILMVPRAKQKNHLSRDEFKARPLSLQLGNALQKHIESIQAQFSGLLEDTGMAPIFPASLNAHSKYFVGFEYHLTPVKISKLIIETFQKLKIPSERINNNLLPVTAIRFRRTFATRAAEEGLPLLVIAELMDHSDTRYVSTYAGLTTRIRANFSRKIAMQMAPLAQVFSGKIINNEVDATRPDPSSRIIDLRVDQAAEGMGSCGTNAYCSFAKPIACYACNSFEPWLDGPHEAMLNFMLQRREELIKTTDRRIASINDRSILGCAQIVIRCSELKKRE